MQHITYLRANEARSKFANAANSTWYDMVSGGTMTPGVKLGAKVVAWPEHELEAIAAARLAGADDEAVRKLVSDLMVARKKSSGVGVMA